MVNSRFSARKLSVPLIVASALISMSMSSPAFAENPATGVASSASGLIINLKLASLVGVGLTSATIAGSAPPSYSPPAKTVASVGQTLSLGSATGGLLSQGVSTGVIASTASGILPTSTASSTVNGLGLNLRLAAITLLGVNATTLSSTTSFNGTVLTGSSNIVGLSLSTLLPGVSLGAAVNGTPAANTVITSALVEALGLTIVENEQILSTTTTGTTHTDTLTTNALHISYKDFLIGGQALSGDIIVSQSTASFTRAVPEASTWAMLILGLGSVGASLRLRNRANSRGKTILRFGNPQAA